MLDLAINLPASLLVTIDTEEEGLWSDSFRRSNNTVENVHGVERFQRLCNEHGIRPTYLVDAPIVDSDWAFDLLAEFQEQGLAEIGAHVHPWCNPPFEEEITEKNTFLCNLPPALQEAKIQWLTETIAAKSSRRPTSFRAGRYGLDEVGYRLLAKFGYTVDSSTIPFSDFRNDGGPDYRNADCDPRYLPDLPSQAQVLEVPVTVGFNRRNFSLAKAIRDIALCSPLRQLRCVGLLDRIGLVQRIKFSPEQATLQQLKRLANVRFQQGARCLVLMFHSSSLLPGLSPYVKDSAQLEEFYRRLEGIFSHCLQSLRMQSLTLTEFADRTTTHPTHVPINGAID